MRLAVCSKYLKMIREDRMEFSLLSSIEWELINVNSQLVIAKIQEIEKAKHVERREKELRELAEFQVMEFKMALDEKETIMIEKVREEAEQARERIELAEFEMLERHFEDEKKLTELEKELCEEGTRYRRWNNFPSSSSIFGKFTKFFNNLPISALTSKQQSREPSLLTKKQTITTKPSSKEYNLQFRKRMVLLLLLLLYRKEPATWKLKSVSVLFL